MAVCHCVVYYNLQTRIKVDGYCQLSYFLEFSRRVVESKGRLFHPRATKSEISSSKNTANLSVSHLSHSRGPTIKMQKENNESRKVLCFTW